MSARRPVPVPLIPPIAALVIWRDCGRYLKGKAADMAAAQPQMARELLVAIEQLEEVARQVVDNLRIAADGNAALPSGPVDAWSGRPPRSGLTTREVAEMLGLKERQVRNLRAPAGPLSATKRGREYLYDETSVELELQRRRSARRGGS